MSIVKLNSYLYLNIILNYSKSYLQASVLKSVINYIDEIFERLLRKSKNEKQMKLDNSEVESLAICACISGQRIEHFNSYGGAPAAVALRQ